MRLVARSVGSPDEDVSKLGNSKSSTNERAERAMGSGPMASLEGCGHCATQFTAQAVADGTGLPVERVKAVLDTFSAPLGEADPAQRVTQFVEANNPLYGVGL